MNTLLREPSNLEHYLQDDEEIPWSDPSEYTNDNTDRILVGSLVGLVVAIFLPFAITFCLYGEVSPAEAPQVIVSPSFTR